MIVRPGIRPALRRCLIHLPSITITISFLAFGAKDQLWTSRDILSIMQFVAKLHEVLIVASLSTIVLHRIRYCLLGRGIQLGFLASSFQLSSILYHAKTEFWGALHFSHPLSKDDLITTVLLLLSFVLATVAGPSSAIAIVPKLAFYDSVRFGSQASNSQIFVQGSFEQLYPEYVNASILPDHCLGNNATLYRECPSAGLLSILGSRFVEAITVAPADYQGIESIDIAFRAQDSTNGLEKRNLRTLLFREGNDLRANAAESPPDYIPAAFVHHRTTAAFGQEVGLHGIGVKVTIGNPHIPNSKSTNSDAVPGALLMPVASTSCVHSFLGEPNIILPLSAFDEMPWNSSATSNVTEINSSVILGENLSNYSGNPNFTWIDTDALQIKSPLAGLFVVNSGDEKTGGHVYACTVEARWVGSQFETQPNSRNLADWIVKKWDVASPKTDLTGGESLRNHRPIRIDVSWAKSQNVEVDNLLTGHTAVELLGSQCVEKVLRRPVTPDRENELLEGTRICFETILALFITDGLARIRATPPMELTQGYLKTWDRRRYVSNVSMSELQNSDLYTHLPVHMEYHGYGYNLRDPIVKVAFSALLLHTLLALTHIFILLRSRRSSHSWHRVGDLVALAINSKPSASLRGTGAGVGKGSTWALRLRVNVQRDDRIGLLIDKDVPIDETIEGREAIATGKKYN